MSPDDPDGHEPRALLLAAREDAVLAGPPLEFADLVQPTRAGTDHFEMRLDMALEVTYRDTETGRRIFTRQGNARNRRNPVSSAWIRHVAHRQIAIVRAQARTLELFQSGSGSVVLLVRGSSRATGHASDWVADGGSF